MSDYKRNMEDQYNFQIENGISYVKKGDYINSEKCFLAAIKNNPIKFQAYINLSNLYIIRGNLNKSTNLLLNYLKNTKLDKDISDYLGKICIHYNLDKELKKLFAIYELSSKNYNKDKRNLYLFQASYYKKNSDYTKAIESYKKAILCDSKFFESYINILDLSESINNLSLFEEYISIAFNFFEKTNKINILIFYKSLLLNRQKKYTESNILLKKNRIIETIKTSDRYYPKILDLESKNLEKIKDFKGAFKKIQLRNNYVKNLKENRQYKREKINNTINSYKKFFNNRNYSKIKNSIKNYSNSNLVFLIGFPRSGTTLLDTILRTHSKINVLEEKPFLLEARHKYFKNKNNNLKSLMDITQKEIDEIRYDYLRNIDSTKLKNSIIIDKFPLSMIELGFIKIIFPDSKIILSLRHPCDVITSCFFSFFKINDAMINFLDLNHTVDFYNRVFDLFEFYEKELNFSYFAIKYENIVIDFKKEVSSLLNFMGLSYEQKLENFFLTAQKRDKIFTPSYSQVIDPLYKSSIGRWENYLEIKNIEKNLNKWINKFNY